MFDSDAIKWFEAMNNAELMFEGPVHRTKKKTETGLNWTAKNWSRGLFMDWSFAVQLAVIYF